MSKLLEASAVAKSVPFDPINTSPQVTATDVQGAIEQLRTLADAIDRYAFQATYNGNANVGRYLEFFPGISSLEAPVVFPEDARVLIITLGSTNSAGDFTIGLFKSTDLINPIGTVTILDGVSRQLYLVSFDFNSLDELDVRVIAGSRSKPFMRIWASKRT